MQKITRIAALLLVVLAVVLAFVAFSLGRRNATPAEVPVGRAAASPDTTTNAAVQTLVIAANALPAGQPILLSSLRMDSAPQHPPGSYTSLDAVVGDVPLVNVPADTPITAGLLAHGVAMELQHGERALAVPVDELAGAGNRILPGDYVDVFLSLKDASSVATGPAKDQTQTRLLLSRLRVLAYGDQDLPTPPASANKSSAAVDVAQAASRSSSSTPPPPRTAVLAVPVAEVDQLLLGAQNGKLALALRHPSDGGKPDGDLFPQPSMVLTPLASLTNEQRQQLATPENDAYAGIDGVGLAGHSNGATHPATFHHAGGTQGVEIIRGTQRNDESHAAGAHSP
ncbi:MAG: Flp pilus assembly protein CpaB [Rhodanobacter sp.]